MNRNIRNLFAALLLLVTSAVTFGAQRQAVLVDGFTQWNCGPCASWNPQEATILEAFTRDTVVAIKTHGWWPGANNDAFHLWNVAEATQRINYYGCNWVPWVMIDGIVDLSNVNATGLRNGVRTRYSTPSPCTIDNLVATTIGTNQVQVAGTINAEQDITGMRLMAVLITDMITYASAPGTNGETQFPEAFRDAYPNFNTGEVIAASPGSPYNFEATLNRDPSWDVENLTIIVIVQNNTTHEVLQANYTSVSQDYAFTFTSEEPAQNIVPTNGGNVNYTFYIDNIGLLQDTYTVSLDGEWPTGWTHTIEANGVPADPTSIDVTVQPQGTATVTVRVNPSGNAGNSSFSVNAASNGQPLFNFGHDYRLMSGLDILIVDGDGGDDYESYFEQAFDDANVAGVWGRWDTALDDLDISHLQGVDVVIWFTGDLWQETLTPLDQLNIQDYLDLGGKLFITGQGIGFDMRNDQFFTDYMHAAYQRNFPQGVSVTGSGLFQGLTFGLTGSNGANNQTRQSALHPRDEMAIPLCVYDQQYQGETFEAGLTVDNGTYRILYLAFGLEAVNSAATRADILGRGVTWLLTGLDAPQAPTATPTEFAVLQNFPNPFNPETTIPFTLPLRSDVTVKIHDLLGREVATLSQGVMDAGYHAVNFNASDLSSGVYFYTVKAVGGNENFSATRKLVLMK